MLLRSTKAFGKKLYLVLGQDILAYETAVRSKIKFGRDCFENQCQDSRGGRKEVVIIFCRCKAPGFDQFVQNGSSPQIVVCLLIVHIFPQYVHLRLHILVFGRVQYPVQEALEPLDT